MDGSCHFPELKDLADRQTSRLPNGALGAPTGSSVTVGSKVSMAQVDLMADYNAGKIGDFDLVKALKELRPPQPPVEPVRQRNPDEDGGP